MVSTYSQVHQLDARSTCHKLVTVLNIIAFSAKHRQIPNPVDRHDFFGQVRPSTIAQIETVNNRDPPIGVLPHGLQTDGRDLKLLNVLNRDFRANIGLGAIHEASGQRQLSIKRESKNVSLGHRL